MTRRLPLILLAVASFLAGAAVAHAAAKKDRDRDRLPDKWEKRYGLSTKAKSGRRDRDRDGLSNRREFKLRTNPRRKDTDRDKLRDGAEVKRHKTNPRRKDTDRDGLSDYLEVKKYKTNPRRKDTDKDGIPDKQEIKAGSNPSDPGSTPPPAPGQGAPPSAAACTASGNVPGGRDPWGSCWPSAANTGVPDGAVLSPYPGPCTITAANTVIDSRTVNCSLEIRAANVTITNSMINGTVYVDDPDSSASFNISDSTIDAGPVSGSANDGATAIGKSNFVATRIETVRGIRGVWCEYDCTLQDSWIHGQDRDEGGAAHQSAVRMGDGSVIRHNTLLCDAPNVAPDAGCSANLTGYGDFAPIRNNTIERNLFMATPGGTCAYGGASGKDGSKPYGSQSANIVFRDNVFQRRSSLQTSGKCGEWFAIADFDRNRPGNQFVGNRWDDGRAVSASG